MHCRLLAMEQLGQLVCWMVDGVFGSGEAWCAGGLCWVACGWENIWAAMPPLLPS